MLVSTSGYYYWKGSLVSERSKRDDYILLKIIRSFRDSKQRYGSPRVYEDLLAEGIKCGVNKVAKVMRKHGLRAVTSVRHKKAQAAKNRHGLGENILNRNFQATKPNQKWVSDTTFVRTTQGWLYLATVIDLYTRKVVGWSMSDANDTALVTQALIMAVASKARKQEVLLHSDQGSTYRAAAYLELFNKYHITQSMSRKGKCHDNAVAESFFSTLKNELVYQNSYKTREQARSSIFEYIEVFYNRERRHSYLNYQSPLNFERAHYNTM